MSVIQVDKRRIEAEPAPHAARLVFRQRRELRRRQIQLALAFLEIEESGHYLLEGCAGVGEYGRRLGYGATETRGLVDLGRALRYRPEVEGLLLEGRLLPRAASLLGRLEHENALSIGGDVVREGEDWVHDALTLPPHVFQRRVFRRIEEYRQKTRRLLELTLHVTRATTLRFQRARRLASRFAQRPLTNGQTLAVLTEQYLRMFDPLLQPPGAARRKRQPPGPRSRRVPADVAREIRERSEDRCEVGDCTNETYLEFLHLGVPFSQGGTQTVHSLARGCTAHHTQYDAGLIRLAGWSEDDHPVFETRTGTIMGRRRPRDPPASTP